MRNFIIILSLFCFLSVHAKKNKTLPCSTHISKLIYAEKEFTECTVEAAVPVTFCEACKSDYDLLIDHYNAFANANDTRTNVSCKSIYFDRDRLNIVETVYDQLVGLWNKGFCSECWSNWNETFDMSQNITDFESCIPKHKDPCVACKEYYLKINTMYESIERRHKGNVCFDLQDMMNRTRITWSKDLKCCKREPNLIAYSAVSAALTSLVVIFYGSMIILTKRAERNHGTIDNANGENDTTRSVDSTASNNRSQPTRNISLPGGSAGPSSSSFRRSSNDSLNKEKEQSRLKNEESEESQLLVQI